MSFGAMFRRKHSELKGELSNLYNHEEKLLSEVCYYMTSVQCLCTFSLLALFFLIKMIGFLCLNIIDKFAILYLAV